jgi:hypothetical protein
MAQSLGDIAKKNREDKARRRAEAIERKKAERGGAPKPDAEHQPSAYEMSEQQKKQQGKLGDLIAAQKKKRSVVEEEEAKEDKERQKDKKKNQ